jgi:hypothetical protein
MSNLSERDLAEELKRDLTDEEMLAELRVIHLEASKRTGAIVQVHHYDRGTTNFKWSDDSNKWECVSVIYQGEDDPFPRVLVR